MRRWTWGAVVFAVLWMGWALLLAAIASGGGPLARGVGVLPGVPGIFYGWSFGWALVGGILTAALAGLAYLLIGRMLSKKTMPTFAAGWLAAILAGVIVGIAHDLPDIIRGFEMFGIRGILNEPFHTQKAVFWAVWAGWAPAIVVSMRASESPVAKGGRSLVITPISTVIAVGALVGVGIAGDAAADEQRTQETQEQAEAEKTAVGLVPDPEAPGEPVPARASTTDSVPDDACTSENSMLLIGASDAATGHRGQIIQLTNFSEDSCVVEGYPDIAFGDQNAHELAVTVEHGRSFMGEDPGPVRIELPAHGTATAIIGWDANSTHGALVAHALHAATRAGEERGSWPVILDIVEGSTVTVTAWH